MKVLIIDAHPVMLSGLKREIHAHLLHARVILAEQAKDGIELIKKRTFDLIIIEIGIKDGGLKVVSRIKAIEPRTKILVYSALDEASYALSTISAGANGFLSKEKPREELRLAIDTVINSKIYLSSTVRESVVSKAVGKMTVSAESLPKTPLQSLTSRENAVMQLLLEGYKISEIATKLNVKDSTVSSFKAALFKKMEVDSVVGLAKKIALLK